MIMPMSDSREKADRGDEALRYEPSPKHHKNVSGYVTPPPADGQAVLDRSLPLSETTTRRVGIDPELRAFIVFDETHPHTGIFHGYVRPWSRMTERMRQVLIKYDLADRKGNVRLPQG